MSKYEEVDLLAPDLEESVVEIQGTLQPSISAILTRHNFVDTFLDDAALNRLFGDLGESRVGNPGTEVAVFNSAVVDVCLKYLSHPGYLIGANQLLISSMTAGLKHHYLSPSIIIASSSTSTSSSRSILFPSSPALSRLLTPLETNVIRLLVRLDGETTTTTTSDTEATAPTDPKLSLEDNQPCMQLLGECHRKIFDNEDFGKYGTLFLQRFVRVASALYVFFSYASSFRVFLFDLLRTTKSTIADKILLFVANAIVIWPHLVLGYRGKDDPVSPLAMTLRHVISKKLLSEAKKQVAAHARPMHDLYHEWVIPLIPSPPGVNGTNFSKTSFAQTIFLNNVLNDQVDKSRNLVVVTQDDIETSSLGLEYLKCLTLLGSQQSWGWVNSILLESFCLKEVNHLGLSLEFLDDEDGIAPSSSSPSPSSSKHHPTHEGNFSYSRALFLLYAIPHVLASTPLSNANDVSPIATRLCHALESAASAYSAAPSSSTSTSSTADSSTALPTSTTASSTADSSKLGPTWEVQLVLVNVLVHLIFLESVGRSLKAKKRIVDAIFRWMEAKSKTLQKYCPSKLIGRLTKVLVLKKGLC